MAGCGGDDDDAADTNPAIEVTGAWARSSPSMASAGAVYFTIDNSGAADALVAASVEATIAGRAEIHEVVPASEATRDGDDMHGDSDMDGDMGGDMMVMQQVMRLAVPAEGTVTLEPGGYHIMLLDLVEPLATGDSFDVVLEFEQFGDVTVTADVRDTAP